MFSSLMAFVPTSPISIGVCLLVGAIAVRAAVMMWLGARNAKSRIAELQRMITGLEQADLVWRRGELAEVANGSSDQHIRDAWREFDETLVATSDGGRIWNTQPAEMFFGTQELAPEIHHNRFLTASPSILTALGVLGTFAGLAYGLGNMGLSSRASLEDLMSSLDVLIEGAGAAFVTSLWGVFFSVVLTITHRIIEQRTDSRIDALQRTIDGLFENHSPEESLLHIQQDTNESVKAINAMGEKIGNKLQEVMGQGYAQAAVQSSEVFEVLVEKFTEEFRAMGTSLASRLENATTELSTTLNGVAEATARQVALLDEHLPRVVTNLDHAAVRIKEVSDGLGPAAEKLRATADIFDRSAGALGDAVADGVEKLDDLGDRTASAVTTVARVGEQLESLSATTLTAAELIGEAAGQVNGGFTELQDRLKALTTSVNEWLNDYEREVGKQVETRMSEWNTHTRDYSDQMTRVTRALADLLEELESSASRSGNQFDRLHESLGVYTDTLGTAITRIAPEPVARTADTQVARAGEVTGVPSDVTNAQG
ncbi:anti-phage ZorAB system protein ZorA [Promicromonospora sp. NPDC023987]|uniref:anti-phage ZorAB system protein ZorA n=1 Tax=Promicromonospora sp. NPDC023987 TaxID=3155360 RepID=UPI0033D18E5A